MKYALIAVLALASLTSCKNKSEEKTESMEDMPTMTETNDAWETLFDGSNFDQWRGYLRDTMPSEWHIEGDAMVFTPGEGGANIITRKKYTDFILSLDWKISEAGNSGVFFGVSEQDSLPEAYETGPEIQVLDNERHPDAKANPKFHQAGALYDLVQPMHDVCKPAGEWNHLDLMVNHKTNEGSVTLNGTKIVEFPVHGAKWDSLVANSKFKDYKDYGKYKTGYIGLQDHGNEVSFKNIKIKPLNE